MFRIPGLTMTAKTDSIGTVEIEWEDVERVTKIYGFEVELKRYRDPSRPVDEVTVIMVRISSG